MELPLLLPPRMKAMHDSKNAVDTKVSIILPVYNEEDILEDNIKKISDFLDDVDINYELVICDDNSNDKTHYVIKTLKPQNHNLVCLRFHQRVGKGGTIRNALQVASGEILVFMDADLSTNLKHIPKLVKEVEKTKGLVIGVRDRTAKRSFARLFLSIGYNHLVELLFRIGISDSQCGFKGIKADVAKLLFQRIRCDGFLFDTELLVNAKRLKVPIATMPVKWEDHRPKGTSKVAPLKTMVTMLADLIILRLSRINGTEIIKLKKILNGLFTDQNRDSFYPAIDMVIDVGNKRILSFLRTVYQKVAFN